MKLKLGVSSRSREVAGQLRRAARRAARSSTLSSMIEWKYTNGLWRAAYWSSARRRLGVVAAVQRRVRAEAALALGVVAHVLHVALPREAARLELVGDRLHARRVHAALSERLAVGAGEAPDEVA